MKRIILTCVLLAISACGNDASSQQGSLLKTLSVLGNREPDVDIRQTVSPQLLAQIPTSVMLLEIPEIDVQALIASVGARNGHETWITQDGVTISLRDGVLSTTRGFGNDLVNADLDQVIPAMRRGSGSAIRLHQYLNGEERIETRAFVCDYSNNGSATVQTPLQRHQTTQIRESCKTSDREIENIYWIERSGLVRKSIQWIGPFNEYVTLDRLKD